MIESPQPVVRQGLPALPTAQAGHGGSLPGFPTDGAVSPVTVIVPVYNEEGTVEFLLRRLAAGPYPGKQVIVVDDGSRDGTPGILARWASSGGIELVRHPHNRGKGAAVR